jgi:endonuclease-3 related protein
MKKSTSGGADPPIMKIYRLLFDAFGPQGWWPAETPFEVAVGAILTQNTNWKNVEKALGNLREAGVLHPAGLCGLRDDRLAGLIRPAGYFNVKSARLKNFLQYLSSRHRLDMGRLAAMPGKKIRRELLAISGIGPETADSIVLYACGRLSFVVDAYTRRIASRHGLCPPRASYHELQEILTAGIPRSLKFYKEFHALIVRAGKEHCRPVDPRCVACPLGGLPVPHGAELSFSRP